MNLKITLSTLLAAVAFSTANADPLKNRASRLLEMCQPVLKPDGQLSINELSDSRVCIATIEGTLYGFELARHLYNGKKYYCVPDNVTIDQLARIVVKHLQDHPESLHESSNIQIINSVINAFPCTKSSKP